MKAVFVSAAFAAAVSAGYEGLIPGTTVPLIYNDEITYPDTVYNGTQYNATTINGVAYNNSNEWPCLDEAGYVSILPTCADYCIKLALSQDECDVDDFNCHCETLHSNKLDTVVVPCLTEGATATCDETEILELVNFVHGALCPYFEAVTTEAYANCPYSPTSSASPTASGYATETDSSYDSEETDCEDDGESWNPDGPDGYETATTTVTGWHTSTTEVCETSTVTSWEHTCTGPTTWGVGTETWTVTESTVITITNWPVTVTTTLTSTWSEAWTEVYNPATATWTAASWTGSGDESSWGADGDGASWASAGSKSYGSGGAWGPSETGAKASWTSPAGGAKASWTSPAGGAKASWTSPAGGVWDSSSTGVWDSSSTGVWDSSSTGVWDSSSTGTWVSSSTGAKGSSTGVWDSSSTGAWPSSSTGAKGSTTSAAGGAWDSAAAGTSASSTGSYPAQFTGAASNNKVAAGVVGVAAAAALLI